MLKLSSMLGYVVLFCLPLMGCGPSSPEGSRPTAPVAVTVTYNGEAVEGATVTMISQDGEPIAAYGRTDAGGVAQMKTYVEGDGAVLGNHKVLISKMETTGGGPDTEQPLEEYEPPELSGDTAAATVEYFVPQKYGSPATSDLTAEVTSGKNELRFDLTD